jgi:hypothetical protein
MWIFFGFPVLIICFMIGVHVSESLDEIKTNWVENRCNPAYIPFAGFINPDVGTQQNFIYCTNQLGAGILKGSLDSIHGMFGTLLGSLFEVTSSLGLFREMFTRLRKFMLSFAAATFSKIASSSSVFIHYLFKLQDILKRFVGQGYIASYLTYIIVSFIESFVVLFMSLLKSFVIAMLIISFVLALFQPQLLVITLVLASILASAGA